MNFITYDHCSGLAAVPAALRQEIEAAIHACTITPARRKASEIGSTIVAGLIACGWSGKVKLARGSKITITSTKNGIGLCLQTGNMARLYADLLKLQQMFLNKTIKAGVMIVPTRAAAKKLGDNIAHANRLQCELEIFRSVIHMPLIVIAVD
ncbi:BglII/BstYI family type II restriction endonuclease [Thauera sp. SDU_THAU2]|uniref:BglII/BstYI family type II restriction endonuclease n=1 Tax=Thauera sp. SDU_THAU2 TaxID=3136633 RepID=UPI00312041D4